MPKKMDDWEDIGRAIGKKIEQEKGTMWQKPWFMHREDGSGFVGRLLFVIGLVWILNTRGYMLGISGWAIALIIIGFALMKF